MDTAITDAAVVELRAELREVRQRVDVLEARLSGHDAWRDSATAEMHEVKSGLAQLLAETTARHLVMQRVDKTLLVLAEHFHLEVPE